MAEILAVTRLYAMGILNGSAAQRQRSPHGEEWTCQSRLTNYMTQHFQSNHLVSVKPSNDSPNHLEDIVEQRKTTSNVPCLNVWPVIDN